MKDCRDFCGGFLYIVDYRLPQGKYNRRRRYNLSTGKYNFAEQNITPVFTSLVLTSISFRQATLPTERAPFVALRHFPRFIGEIHPIGESKESEFFQRYID